jgi:hypothetical protein
MGQFNADSYNTVAERLQEARAKIQSITTEPPVMLTDVMGYMRATVVLKDGEIGTGTASFRLDLQTRSAQATNPIEDCETSAVGRALAMLGYATTKGVASQEEIAEARRREAAVGDRPRGPARGQGGFTTTAPVETVPAGAEYIPVDESAAPVCPHCNVPMQYGEGVSNKTGKPWARYKCQQKRGGEWCNHTEWL